MCCLSSPAHGLSVHVPKRENPIVNRLNKTKVEREVDHEQERIERIKKENAAKRAAAAAKVRLCGASIIDPMLTDRNPYIAEKGRRGAGTRPGSGEGCTVLR